jgi:hypothetical protein
MWRLPVVVQLPVMRLSPPRTPHSATLTHAPPGSDDVAEEAPGLLLAYLSDPRRASHAATASARAFLLCQAFAEEVTHLQKAGAAQEQLTEKLVQVGAKARGGEGGGERGGGGGEGGGLSGPGCVEGAKEGAGQKRLETCSGNKGSTLNTKLTEQAILLHIARLLPCCSTGGSARSWRHRGRRWGWMRSRRSG